MDLRLEQVGPESVDEVISFVRKIFQAPLDAPFLQIDHVRWKLFEPRPDWEGSRGYVFREQGRIVAHVCVVPTTYMTPDGAIIRSIFPIDWAADRSIPGVGLVLQKDVAGLADIRIGFGGSAIAKALERKGHARKHPYEKIAGELVRSRRSFRPWSPFRRRGISPWTAMAHTARNIWQLALRPAGASGEWAARPVERFDAELPNLELHGNPTRLTLPMRTPELLNYMLLCPSVRFSGFLLEKSELVRGHLLLTDLGEEVRIADLVIDSDAVDDWVACYTLALSTARRHFPRGGYLRATAAPSSLQWALLQAGFTEEVRHAVIVQAGRSALPPECLPVLNMMDNDAAYYF